MNKLLYYLIPVFLITSCIGEDILNDEVEPTVRITNSIDMISIDSTHQYDFQYLNNIGMSEQVTPTWSVSNTDVATISQGGILTAIAEGQVTVSINFTNDEVAVSDMTQLNVVAGAMETVMTQVEKSGTIQTTSTYQLEGTFTVVPSDNGINLNFNSDFRASDRLPRLVLFLTNNPNSIQGAKRVGEVDVFSGAHVINVENVDIEAYSHLLYYCEPFNVKVGDAALN